MTDDSLPEVQSAETTTHNFDQTYGGHQNYNADPVYSSLQYRF